MSFQTEDTTRWASQGSIANADFQLGVHGLNYNLAIWLQSVFITSDEDKILDLEAKLATCKAYPAHDYFWILHGRPEWLEIRFVLEKKNAILNSAQLLRGIF